MIATGANSCGCVGGVGCARGSNCCSRYSAVILSRELDGTLAAEIPISFALERTNLLSRLSFLAMS